MLFLNKWIHSQESTMVPNQDMGRMNLYCLIVSFLPFFYSFYFFFETGCYSVVLAGMELSMWTKVASSLNRSKCTDLCLLSVGNKGMCHDTWYLLFKQ